MLQNSKDMSQKLNLGTLLPSGNLQGHVAKFRGHVAKIKSWDFADLPEIFQRFKWS
jgi:hypothetical protein